MLTTREHALEQIREFGLDVDFLEIDSPSSKRVSFTGKRKRNLDGFYQVFSFPNTHMVAGYYGTFYGGRTVEKLKGSADAYQRLSEAQKFKFKQAVHTAKRKVNEFEPDLSIWDKAEVCKQHPYLTKKSISPNGLKVIGEELLIPYENLKGDLVGIQRILPNSRKFMIKGSKMSGAFHEIKGSDVVAVCEGFATGCSIHEVTGWTVICAFSCTNLERVAGYFKHKRLIICADNDFKTLEKTGKNPGLDAGKAASKKFFAPLVYPPNHDSLTDFNDYPPDKIKEWLKDEAPKSFIQQVIDCGVQSARERFIIERKELIGNYSRDELAFLKNRLKELDITKSFVDDAIKGVKSEEELEKIREAQERFTEFRVMDGKYYILSNDQFYLTSEKHVDLVLKMASEDNLKKKEELINELHQNRCVEIVEAVPIPVGKSYIREYLGSEGKLVIKKHVSIQEIIESRLSELEEIEVNQNFVGYIEKQFPEVIDILDAALARKFCYHKKSFVYFKCNSDYGKTFFFLLQAISEYFEGEYTEEKLRGNSPSDYVRAVYFYIDEATKFPALYKINTIRYRRIYQGLCSFEIGMRIMACCNTIGDLERGADEQIQNRVITIIPKENLVNHHKIERKLSKKMYEKWTLIRLNNMINQWSSNGDFEKEAQAFYDNFVKKYDSEKKVDLIKLEDVLWEHLCEVMNHIHRDQVNNETKRSLKGVGGFDFAEYIERCKDGSIVIRSPMKFFKEIFKFYDESRLKAFIQKFGNLKELESIPFLNIGRHECTEGQIRGAKICPDIIEISSCHSHVERVI